MTLYELTIKYRAKQLEKELNTENAGGMGVSQNNNRELEINRLLHLELRMNQNMSAFITSICEEAISLVTGIKLEKASFDECRSSLESFILAHCGVEEIVSVEVKEICVSDLCAILQHAETNECIKSSNRCLREMKLDYCDNRSLQVREDQFQEVQSYKAAKAKAKQMKADASLLEELGRIYASENEKKYYGHPVHYCINTTSKEAAWNIVNLLCGSLYANGRLLGKRVTYLSAFTENCYDEVDVTNIFDAAQGNVVVLEIEGKDRDNQGIFADSFERVIHFLAKQVTEYNMNTLCIFVVLSQSPGFSKDLLSLVQEEVDLVDISEGIVNLKSAREYVRQLSLEGPIRVNEEELEQLLDENRRYSIGELHDMYASWKKKGLRYNIYPSYRKYNFCEKKEKDESLSAYDELQNMVGLSDIKRLVDQIVASAKMEKLRKEMGMSDKKNSLHMVFTGNPGSAKTTVARLLSRILSEEGIIENGQLVECGRSDLVGKYVGWTAKQVKSQFVLAKGGILFIDEAYSLVDGSNSFGDEAINTIVQEMENRREDVIVIFAGYPDRMEEFLEKNEGLRSRMAFFIDFPDYNSQELMDILDGMVKARGFAELDERTRYACYRIFEDACRHSEFGNGRFARNLLEQAVMKQSKRIVSQYKAQDITKDVLRQLVAEDFEVNAKAKYKEKKPTLGFAV